MILKAFPNLNVSIILWHIAKYKIHLEHSFISLFFVLSVLQSVLSRSPKALNSNFVPNPEDLQLFASEVSGQDLDSEERAIQLLLGRWVRNCLYLSTLHWNPLYPLYTDASLDSSFPHFWKCSWWIVRASDGSVLYLSFYSNLMHESLDSSKYLG